MSKHLLLLIFVCFSSASTSFATEAKAKNCAYPLPANVLYFVPTTAALSEYQKQEQTQSKEKNKTVEAKIERLRAEGFDCKIPSNKKKHAHKKSADTEEADEQKSSWECVGTLAPYSQPDPNSTANPKPLLQVALYIPAHYVVTPQPKLTVHFQGWQQGLDFKQTLEKFEMGKELEASGDPKKHLPPDRIIIFPQSTGGFGKYALKQTLSTRKQFAELTQSALKLIDRVGLSDQPNKEDPQAQKISVSGHSGAYGPISSVLNDTTTCPHDSKECNFSITGISLFDATYPQRTKTEKDKFDCFYQFAKSPKNHLYVVFQKGSDTESTALDMKAKLSNLPNVKIKDATAQHMDMLKDHTRDSLQFENDIHPEN